VVFVLKEALGTNFLRFQTSCPISTRKFIRHVILVQNEAERGCRNLPSLTSDNFRCKQKAKKEPKLKRLKQLKGLKGTDEPQNSSLVIIQGLLRFKKLKFHLVCMTSLFTLVPYYPPWDRSKKSVHQATLLY